MAETVTRQLAKFAAGLRYEDLPVEVVAEVSRLLLDTIGCGLGGHAVEKGQMAVRYARQMGAWPRPASSGFPASCPPRWRPSRTAI